MSGRIKGKRHRERSGLRCFYIEKLSAMLRKGEAPRHVFYYRHMAAARLKLGDMLLLYGPKSPLYKKEKKSTAAQPWLSICPDT